MAFDRALRLHLLALAASLIFTAYPSQAQDKPSVKKARALVDIGMYDQALRTLQKDNSTPAILIKAYANRELDDGEQTRILYVSVLAREPGNLDALINYYSYILHWRTEAPQALNAFLPLTRKYPNNADLQSVYGRALFQTGHTKDGLKVMEDAFKKAPDSIECALGLAAVYKDQIEESKALKTLDEAIKHHPRSIELLLARADLYKEAGNAEKALADFARVFQISPGCQIALAQRADMLFLKGQFQKSIDDAERGLSLGPSPKLEPKLLRSKMHSAARLGKWQDAIAAGEILTRGLDNRTSVPGKTLEDLLQQTHNYIAVKDYASGLKTAKLLLKFCPGKTEGLLLKAQCNAGVKDYGAALTDYNKLIEMDDSMPDWLRERAAVLTKLGKTSLAASDLARAKQLDSGH